METSDAAPFGNVWGVEGADAAKVRKGMPAEYCDVVHGKVPVSVLTQPVPLIQDSLGTLLDLLVAGTRSPDVVQALQQ